MSDDVSCGKLFCHSFDIVNSAPLGDTNRTLVVYKQKPTYFQCDHLLTAVHRPTQNSEWPDNGQADNPFPVQCCRASWHINAQWNAD